MIHGMNIFYNSKIVRGLKVVSTAKGLQPVQNKSKKVGSCNKKCNNKNIKDQVLEF